MSKRTPGSKYAIKQGRERYKKERERHRQRVVNRTMEEQRNSE